MTDDGALEFGLRATRTSTHTDPVDAFPARLVDLDPAMWPIGTPPRAVWMLRERFNSADLDQTDTSLDAVAKWTHRFGPKVSGSMSFGRKHRAPSYIERYSWMPLEINAGLGDGNNYVGDSSLDPEQANQIELGLSWADARGYVAPRISFNRIDDYIQGSPQRI